MRIFFLSFFNRIELGTLDDIFSPDSYLLSAICLCVKNKCIVAGVWVIAGQNKVFSTDLACSSRQQLQSADKRHCNEDHANPKWIAGHSVRLRTADSNVYKLQDDRAASDPRESL